MQGTRDTDLEPVGIEVIVSAMLKICKSRKPMSILKVLIYGKIIAMYLKTEDDL